MGKIKVLIVGGYGSVGRNIAKSLVSKYHVIIAGRNINKAKALKDELGRNAEAIELDVTKKDYDKSIFKYVKYVIMCLDLVDNTFLETCIKNKINYIDITASYEVMKRLYTLKDKVIENKVNLILSVGLAPGLTNLLVKKVKSYFDQIKRMDIYIMLGSGEKHGKAAILYMLDNMTKKYFIRENGKNLEVKSFGEKKNTIFPNRIGKRKVYRYPISDQMTLPFTQNLGSISTWVCLDSKIMTKLLSLIKPFTKLTKIRKFLYLVFNLINIGSEAYYVKVEGKGLKNDDEKTISLYIHGNTQSKGTAQVTTAVLDLLQDTKIDPGIYHLDQFLEIEKILDKLNGEIILGKIV
ncbi:MAG: SDR family NAD(P)-dependent oxidoreductase [Candidatus Lokiarchaeota archaeon]|nr:SDR family NAD(P)-dependent oxidoreductase [Candidatus Lokiarchaeota archaeon]